MSIFQRLYDSEIFDPGDGIGSASWGVYAQYCAGDRCGATKSARLVATRCKADANHGDAVRAAI
jgi:hypothetical protein